MTPKDNRFDYGRLAELEEIQLIINTLEENNAFNAISRLEALKLVIDVRHFWLTALTEEREEK